MTTVIDRLLDDIDEEYSALGYVGLHMFSWWQRGYELGLTEDEILANCREAYVQFRSTRELRLMWCGWPPDLDNLTEAAPDTPLDFHTHTDDEVQEPFLILTP